MSEVGSFGLRNADLGFGFAELAFGSVRILIFGLRSSDFGLLQISYKKLYLYQYNKSGSTICRIVINL